MTGTRKMDVSVIIGVAEPDYDRLSRQVHQLTRQNTEHSFEVVIGDNAGKLSLTEVSGGVPLTIVDASEVRGVAHARNAAVLSSSGDLLLFCDADDLVAPNWLEAHASALASYEFTAGSFLNVGPDDPSAALAIAGQWPSSGFSTRMRHHEGEPFATSANLGVRRRVFDSVGGFPTAYLRSQDVAFSLALRRMDIVPQFVSGAEVIKVVGKRGRREAMRTAYRSGRSRVRLARDYHVGPRPMVLVLRGAMRTARVGIDVLRTRDHDLFAVLLEAVQLAGVISQSARLR